MAVPYSVDDFKDIYNTPLSPEDEVKFQVWASQHPQLGSTYDYDARGFWKSGAAAAGNGHGSDTFKKPNHPTFSNESQYSGSDQTGGEWVKHPDGTWAFNTSPTNEFFHTKAELKNYFATVERGNRLNYGAYGSVDPATNDFSAFEKMAATKGGD